jgi:putative transcriptional regulator
LTRRRIEAGSSGSAEKAGEDEATAIRLHLDELLDRRGMTLTELSARVGITIVNLSILKNGRARAIRFSTLARLCEALGCQPGELLSYQPGPLAHTEAGPGARREADRVGLRE